MHIRWWKNLVNLHKVTFISAKAYYPLYASPFISQDCNTQKHLGNQHTDSSPGTRERRVLRPEKNPYILVVEAYSYKRHLCEFSKGGEIQLPYSFPHQIKFGGRTVKTTFAWSEKAKWKKKKGVLGKVFNVTAPQKSQGCYVLASLEDQSEILTDLADSHWV